MMFVIPYFLLVLFLVSCRGQECPEDCQCLPRKEGTFTVCVGLNTTTFPTGIPLDTTELIIQGITLQTLEHGSFQTLGSLQSLVLKHCNIENLAPNVFAGLSHLAELDLTHNKLTEIQSYAFSGLIHLKRLTIDYNDLQTLNEFAFHGLNLTKLSIEDNPNLSEVDYKAFHGARIQKLYIFNSSIKSESMHALNVLQTSLQELSWQKNKIPLEIQREFFMGFTLSSLNLNYNGIKDTSFLQYVTADDLSLDGNPLGPVDFSQYPKLKHVRVLKLANTEYSHLEASYFSTLSNLDHLYLPHNGIMSLPEGLKGVFERLERLSLEDNPLHCNCEMVWFKYWLAANTAVTVIGGRCSTPELKDPALMAVKDMRCTAAPFKINISQSIVTGDRTGPVLHCKAEGDPAPELIWTKPDGTSVKAAATSRNFTMARSQADLDLTAPGIEQSGEYRCTAMNFKGNTTTSTHLAAYQFETVGQAYIVKSTYAIITVLIPMFLTLIL